jgi:hypothetical protein
MAQLLMGVWLRRLKMELAPRPLAFKVFDCPDACVRKASQGRRATPSQDSQEHDVRAVEGPLPELVEFGATVVDHRCGAGKEDCEHERPEHTAAWPVYERLLHVV